VLSGKKKMYRVTLFDVRGGREQFLDLGKLSPKTDTLKHRRRQRQVPNGESQSPARVSGRDCWASYGAEVFWGVGKKREGCKRETKGREGCRGRRNKKKNQTPSQFS